MKKEKMNRKIERLQKRQVKAYSKMLVYKEKSNKCIREIRKIRAEYNN